MVGNEVSKQPPWSIATSTSTAPGRIRARSCAADDVRGAGAAHEHRADDGVGLGQQLLDRERGGEAGGRRRRPNSTSSSRRRASERSSDDDVGAHADGDAGRARAGDAAADDQHARRAPRRARRPSGRRAPRRPGSRAWTPRPGRRAGPRPRSSGRAAAARRARPRRSRRRCTSRPTRTGRRRARARRRGGGRCRGRGPGAAAATSDRLRLLDLDDHARRRAKTSSAVATTIAPWTAYVGVADGAAEAGAALDEHLVAAGDELAHARRGQADAALLRLDLRGYADSHLASDRGVITAGRPMLPAGVSGGQSEDARTGGPWVGRFTNRVRRSARCAARRSSPGCAAAGRGAARGATGGSGPSSGAGAAPSPRRRCRGRARSTRSAPRRSGGLPRSTASGAATFGSQALGADLADDERAEVEVLEAHDAPAPSPAQRPARRRAGVAQRVAASAIAVTGRPTPIASAGWAAVTASSAAGGRVLARLDERGQPRPRRRVVRCGAPARRGRRRASAAGASTPLAGRAQDDDPRRAAKSTPNAAARAARGVSPRSLGRGERLLEQRAAHRLLLRARDVAEAAERGEQRRAGLGGGLDEPVEAPGPRGRRARASAAGASVRPRGSAPRPASPVRRPRTRPAPGRAPAHARAQVADGRPADDDLRLAVRADDDHGRVEEARRGARPSRARAPSRCSASTR